MCRSENLKFPNSNPTRHLVGLRDQLRYEAPSDLRVENVKCSDKNRVSEGVPLIMAQSWWWGSQIAVCVYIYMLLTTYKIYKDKLETH